MLHPKHWSVFAKIAMSSEKSLTGLSTGRLYRPSFVMFSSDLFRTFLKEKYQLQHTNAWVRNSIAGGWV